jgi:hypothetical protein
VGSKTELEKEGVIKMKEPIKSILRWCGYLIAATIFALLIMG